MKLSNWQVNAILWAIGATLVFVPVMLSSGIGEGGRTLVIYCGLMVAAVVVCIFAKND